MTLMRNGKGKLLFRHARLGLGNTCGHGHSDALSFLLYWGDVPVFIDLGSGQYNGRPEIRHFFRSTIAHNTIELEGEDQAKALGPFLWGKPYRAELERAGKSPHLYAIAKHNGYAHRHSVLHHRRINWPDTENLEIVDSISGKGEKRIRGAFHLGTCLTVSKIGAGIRAYFDEFKVELHFPHGFTFDIYNGSTEPFMGWRSSIYGKWEPAHSIIFQALLDTNFEYKTRIKIIEG
jgi:hypothetical protein